MSACVERLRRTCLFSAVLITALGGCSDTRWQRLFYDVGDQYSCQQRGANQPTGAARAGQCADATHPDRSRYDDYRQARERELGRGP